MPVVLLVVLKVVWAPMTVAELLLFKHGDVVVVDIMIMGVSNGGGDGVDNRSRWWNSNGGGGGGGAEDDRGGGGVIMVVWWW